MSYRFNINNSVRTITLNFITTIYQNIINTYTLGIDEGDTVLDLKKYIFRSWREERDNPVSHQMFTPKEEFDKFFGTAGYGRIILSTRKGEAYNINDVILEESYNLYDNPEDLTSLDVKIEHREIYGNVDLRGEDLTEADLTDLDLSDANLEDTNLSNANLSNTILTNANLSNTILVGTLLRNANLSGASLRNVDLSGVDLSGVDLSGADLSGSILSHANLSGFDLSHANLSRADLSHVVLTGANLSHANLSYANLSHVNLSDADNLSHVNLSYVDLSDINLSGFVLSHANLSHAILTETDLTGAILSNANLTGAILTGAILTGAILTDAILTGADLRDADLRDADLAGNVNNLTNAVNLTNADLTGADLSHANLFNADLRGSVLKRAKLSHTILLSTDLTNADFEDANLTNADFSGALLQDTIFTNANLTNAIITDITTINGAIFTGANLMGANLMGADLTRAEISGAIFTGVNLSGTNLSGVNLSGTNLSGVNLSSVNLSGVNLSGANLSGANLSGANLSHANLSHVNLSGAKLLQSFFKNATLTNTVFRGANLSRANIKGVDFTDANFTDADLDEVSIYNISHPQIFKNEDEARIKEILRQIPESHEKRVSKIPALLDTVRFNNAGPIIDLLVDNRNVIGNVLQLFDREPVDRNYNTQLHNEQLITQSQSRNQRHLISSHLNCRISFNQIIEDVEDVPKNTFWGCFGCNTRDKLNRVDLISYLNVHDVYDEDEKRNALQKRAVFFVGETVSDLAPMVMSLDQLLYNLHDTLYTSDCSRFSMSGITYNWPRKVKDVIFQLQFMSHNYNVYLRNLIDVILNSDKRVFYILPLIDVDGQRVEIPQVSRVKDVSNNPFGVATDDYQECRSADMYGIYTCDGQGDNPLYPVCSA